MAQKRILLVDDSTVALTMEEMILKNRTSYEVLTARDGSEAVEKARTEHPDLILMDICMPRMNGYEACEALRKQQETKQIPIILLTTRGEQENVETGFASGCNDYITKPINGPELVSLLNNYLGD